ncbi:MAG TPA: hypothetical protein VII33_19955 [Nakamurella sp.]
MTLFISPAPRAVRPPGPHHQDGQGVRAAPCGDNTDRLIQLTCAVGGDDHLTSTRGTDRKYIDRTRVGAAGIVVRSQEFVRPASRQQFEPFEPTLGSSTFPAVVG